jgi:TldD protein
VQVIAEQNGRRESAAAAAARAPTIRTSPTRCSTSYARQAVSQALANLEARPRPAGTMTVVLGPGWPGVLLHEAIGHGLEGDFNRKGSSAFAGRLGQRVASPGVTVVDDGTLPGRRGSLSVDDEARPPAHRADRGRRAARLHAGQPERAPARACRSPATRGANRSRTSRCRA